MQQYNTYRIQILLSNPYYNEENIAFVVLVITEKLFIWNSLTKPLQKANGSNWSVEKLFLLFTVILRLFLKILYQKNKKWIIVITVVIVFLLFYTLHKNNNVVLEWRIDCPYTALKKRVSIHIQCCEIYIHITSKTFT